MKKHKRWSPGTLMAQAYRDIANEHNATVDALEAALAPVPIRVPFSDAQIEAMAEACFAEWYGSDRAVLTEQSAPVVTRWRSAIRAALAAVPCAVPERASDEELKALAIEAYNEGPTCSFGEAIFHATAAVRARVEAPLLAEIEACDLARYAAELERDTLAARVAELEAELVPLRFATNNLLPDAEEEAGMQSAYIDTLRAELEAAQAERDEAKTKAAQAVERCDQLDRQIQSQLAALRQPVDADAWKTELEIDQLFGTSRIYALENQAVIQCEDSYLYFCPTDAARVAAHLSSYAAAHGCPASLGVPETRPVEVGWSVTAEEVRQHWFSIDGADVRAWQTMIDYLATHAVLPVPAGVPSVEALVEIGRAAIPAGYHQSRYREEHFAAAIRNAVLASLPVTSPHAPPAFAHIGKPSRSNAEMQICINRKNRRIEALKACVRKWKAKAHSQKPAPTHTGPTRAEAEAKLAELKHSRLIPVAFDEFRDWLLPQLPTERAEIPSAKEIREAFKQYGEAYTRRENDGKLSPTSFALEYLRPWLRTPPGWELDVPEGGWLSDGFCIHNPATGESHSLESFVSHVCSRIRPTFECKECAEVRKQYNDLGATMQQVADLTRAALEGE